MLYKIKTGNNLTAFKFIILICISLLNQCIDSFSQQNPDYIFRHINQSDGLLNTEVRSIVQDAKGYIWILTYNGLQRYDGSRFVNYTYDLNNPDGIIDTRSADLYADKKNNYLWIMYNSNVQQFDLQKNHFIIHGDKMLKNKNFIFDSYTDSHGSPWLLGDFGIFYYYKDEKKMYPQVLAAPSLTPNKSSPFITDLKNEKTWMVSYGQGLLLFDKKTKRIYTHEYNPIHHPLLEVMDARNYTGIMKDSEHNIWISTGSPYFYKYNTSSKKLSVYSLTDINKSKTPNLNQDAVVNVKCFFEDNHHTIWAGTENAGLLRYNQEEDSFIRSSNDPNNKQGLHYNFVISNIFQDEEENIWLSTDDGINIFNPYRQYFQSIHHEEGNPSSIAKNEIDNFIQAGNGDILAGTWGGGFTVYDSLLNFKKNIYFSNPYEYNMIWSFIQNDDGTIWVGCQHGFIHIYNTANGTIHTIRPLETNNFTIRCMAKDKAGNIWMGLHNGKVAKWDKSQNKFYAYNDSVKGLAQTYNAVLSIFFDSKQRCWVSTETGFKQLDTEKRIYSAVYLPDKNNVHSISASTSGGIEQMNDTTLVIGTMYGGLNFFNISTKNFTHLSTNEGLPSSTIYSLKKDSKNNLWLTTDYRLYKYGPVNKKFIRYIIEPNIINSSFKATGFYPLRDGRWLTATATEMICFQAESAGLQNRGTTKVEITGFNIFDSTVFIDSFLAAGKPVQLNHKQNFLTIEFSVLSFSNLQQTGYYYRLSSVDKDWIYAGTKKFASYTNLQPGEYIFSVKADNGNETTQTTSFTIIIAPPFWKTWWFISLIAVCIILLTYQFIKWRIKSIKAVEAEKLKVQQLNAEQYKNKLELERIVNYFSSSLIDKTTVDDVLWDVAKNLIGRLGFVDCMIYLWNSDKTKMIQRAGYGPKGSLEEIENRYFDAVAGQGVVGYVMQTKEPVLITDTSKDPRYRVDEMERLSEITVPIIYNDELIGVIDSEHHEKNFFTSQHTQVLSTIATLMATKIKSIESEQSLQQAKIEMLGINEKLSEAKLEALRSQMNPHFIFNCLSAIDNLMQTNQPDKATMYLSRFAKLIRSVLEGSKNNLVAFYKDFETLQLFLQLEQFRSNNKFSYEIKADEELLQGDYKVPPLIVQPFAENAIHHGLLNKQQGERKLIIEATLNDTFIKYTIKDNGVGRAKAMEIKNRNKPEHISYGIEITKERIHLHNQSTSHNGKAVQENADDVIISDIKENDSLAGTCVEIRLKTDIQ